MAIFLVDVTNPWGQSLDRFACEAGSEKEARDICRCFYDERIRPRLESQYNARFARADSVEVFPFFFDTRLAALDPTGAFLKDRLWVNKGRELEALDRRYHAQVDDD